MDDQKIQSGKLTVSGTEHPAGQSDPLTSLFPSGKVLFLKKKLEPRVSAVNISRNANGFHLLSKK